MRTFFAIDIEKKVLEKVVTQMEKFRKIEEGVKWVKPENLHITLYFFGEIDDSTLKPLEKVIKGSIAEIHEFPVTVRRVSAFPSIKRPRVIWLGIDNTTNEMKGIFESIKKGLEIERLFVNREEREFASHLTIGRVKGYCNQGLIQEIYNMENEVFGTFSVREFILYKSTLTRGGPIYEKLRIYPL